MLRTASYRFSTIALISGAPRYDPQTVQIATALKAQTNNNIALWGVVGDAHKPVFSKVLASSALLDDNEFEVTRAYNTYDEGIQDSPFIPYRAYTHYCNSRLMKALRAGNLAEELFRRKASAVATVGNFSLALRVGEYLNQWCRQNGKVKPYNVLFHRQHSERTVENEEFIDYQYYNVEKTPSNHSGYIFPSLCVGYDSLYRALAHLQQFRKDSANDSFHSEQFTYDVAQLVLAAREAFRQGRTISQDDYLFYVDGGVNAKEVDFSLKAIGKGLSDFLAKPHVSSLPREHFQILVQSSDDKALASAIERGAGALPLGVKVTLVREAEREAAMSGSDFGLLHNGDATVGAAGVQLPSLVVDSRSNLHAYFNNLYNGHASPLNIATNYEAYEELVGSLTAIPAKIGSIVERNFQTPKLRYYYAKLYRDQIQAILSKSGTNPRLCVSETGLQSGVKHLLGRAEAYSRLDSGAPFRRASERKQALAL